MFRSRINPNSPELIVTVGTETCDSRLAACHTLFHSKIESRRRFTAALHGGDAFLGVPSTSAVCLATHLVAHVCDLEVGEFIHAFGDLHIYSNHLEQVNEVISREPLELPGLELVNADDLKGLDGLLSFRFENLRLENYQSWGKIAAPVAV